MYSQIYDGLKGDELLYKSSCQVIAPPVIVSSTNALLVKKYDVDSSYRLLLVFVALYFTDVKGNGKIGRCASVLVVFTVQYSSPVFNLSVCMFEQSSFYIYIIRTFMSKYLCLVAMLTNSGYALPRTLRWKQAMHFYVRTLYSVFYFCINHNAFIRILPIYLTVLLTETQ